MTAPLSGWLILPGLRLEHIPLLSRGGLLISNSDRGLYSARSATFAAEPSQRYGSLAEAAKAVADGTVPTAPSGNILLRFLRRPPQRAVLLAQDQCIPYGGKPIEPPSEKDLDPDDLRDDLKPVQAFIDDVKAASFGEGSAQAAKGSGNAQQLITWGMFIALAASAAVFVATGFGAI